MTVTVHTAKPGIVIGKGGANVEALRQQIGRLTTRKVKLEIKEIRQPELDAVLVAANIAQQLSPPHRLPQGDQAGRPADHEGRRQGRQISVSGRLGGSEMARREWDKEGRIPLGTLRADISYGQVLSHTTYGAHRRQGLDLPRRRHARAHRAARGARPPRAGGGLAMLMPKRVKHRKVHARPHVAAWPRAARRSRSAITR